MFAEGRIVEAGTFDELVAKNGDFAELARAEYLAPEATALNSAVQFQPPTPRTLFPPPDAVAEQRYEKRGENFFAKLLLKHFAPLSLRS